MLSGRTASAFFERFSFIIKCPADHRLCKETGKAVTNLADDAESDWKFQRNFRKMQNPIEKQRFWGYNVKL